MTWNLDTSHSSVEFAVKHMVISSTKGRFTDYDVDADVDLTNLANSKATVRINAASIDTRDEKRDGHLRSPDFFNAEQYPAITFKSTKVERLDETTGKLYGDLTIRDVTRPVVLDLEYSGQSKSPWGTISAGFSAQTKINRKDFGLNWNVALETGGWLVGEEVKIAIELELVEQVEQPAEAELATA